MDEEVSVHSIEIDLSVSPRERWKLTRAQRRGAKALLAYYKRDLGLESTMLEMLVGVAGDVLPEEHLEEIEGMGEAMGVDVADGLLVNLYYDALKTVWGCTAFSVCAPNGNIHARNLDWWTDERLLSKETLVSKFINGPAGDFLTVGWPGFVGALSGFAPKRFSVTLNSVLSDDAPSIALPVVSLIRQVLQTCNNYIEAVQTLAETPIASDAILMVSGLLEEERVVIERTPNRHAIRRSQDSRIVAANDYLNLQETSVSASSAIASSSCGRFDRATSLVSKRNVGTLEDAVAVLSDPEIRMGITAQQMAFDIESGALLVVAGEETMLFSGESQS